MLAVGVDEMNDMIVVVDIALVLPDNAEVAGMVNKISGMVELVVNVDDNDALVVSAEYDTVVDADNEFGGVPYSFVDAKPFSEGNRFLAKYNPALYDDLEQKQVVPPNHWYYFANFPQLRRRASLKKHHEYPLCSSLF